MARKKTTRKEALDELQESATSLLEHETYDHIYYLEDDPDTLLDSEGHEVRLDDNGEPMYDDETGLPKVRKPRKIKGEKSEPSRPRKVRINPNLKQQSRLPLPGFMAYSRVMLPSGDYVRLMSWGRLTVDRLESIPLEHVNSFVEKQTRTYQDKFHAFVKSHAELGDGFPKTDFRLLQAVLSDGSKTWAVALPESVSGKGLSLQKILKSVAKKAAPAAKQAPTKKSKPKSKKK